MNPKPEALGTPESVDVAIDVEEERLAKLTRLWTLRRQCGALACLCAHAGDDVRNAIVAVVSQHFQFTHDELLSHCRQQRLVWPRFVAMSLILDLTYMTTTEVGCFFRRHHSAVSYARAQVLNRCDVEVSFRTRYACIQSDVIALLAIAPEEFSRGTKKAAQPTRSVVTGGSAAQPTLNGARDPRPHRR